MTTRNDSRESFFTCNPPIATPRESAQAYLQRFVVVILALVCISITWILSLNDCRLYVFDLSSDPDTSFETGLQNITNTSDQILGALGLTSNFFDRGWFSDLDWSPESGNNALFVGMERYAIHNMEAYEEDPNTLECLLYSDYFDAEAAFELDKINFIIGGFISATPYLGTFGVLFAMVESFFRVFYPSVIIGSILLALAGMTDAIALLLVITDARVCFARGFCRVQNDFLEYVFAMGGFFFCSCGLIFGLRTYPWFLRKNRDPSRCKVVEAEIVHDYENDFDERQQQVQPSSLRRTPDIPTEEYQQLKQELETIKLQLVQSQEELEDTKRRAEKAESLLRAGKGARFVSSVLKEENKINDT
jgi:UPF0716 family protein affecting phage T7 exclusion